MVYVIVLLSILLPLALMAWSIEDWSRDLSTNRAATDQAAEHPLMRPLTQRFSVEQLDLALEEICREQSAWSQPEPPKQRPADSLIKFEGQVLAERHLVRTTRLMRYRDDVWLVVTAAPVDIEGSEEKLRVHMESRSRIGKGDLGQNPRNLREINELLIAKLVLSGSSAAE